MICMMSWATKSARTRARRDYEAEWQISDKDSTSQAKGFQGTEQGTHLLRPEMPPLCNFGGLFCFDEPNDGAQAKYQAEDGYRGDPDVDEARGKIIAKRAQRAPAFFIAA